MIETLIAFFKKPKEKTVGETPEGLCANCWGYQDFDNKIREMYVDKQVDVNNHTANYAFIQDFVVNQIVGIHLKNASTSLECPTCRKKYHI